MSELAPLGPNPSPSASSIDVIGTNGEKITIRLTKADFTTKDPPLIGQFQESTFPGYLPVSRPAWNLTDDDGNGSQFFESGRLVFVRTSGESAEDCYGWYATCQGANSLVVISCYRFDQPLPMRKVGDQVALLLMLRVDSETLES